MAHAELRIPVGRDGVPPEQLAARLLDFTAVDIAFGFQHGAVVGAPIPGLQVVRRRGTVVAAHGLEPVHQ
jgi:hypothetical protein